MLIEFKKLFKNKWFYIIFALMLTIVVISTIQAALNYADEVELYKRLFKNSEEPLTTLSPLQFILGSKNNIIIEIYCVLFPTFLAVFLSLNIHNDLRTGNIHYIVTRKSRAAYFIQKYCFTFITAFFVTTIPLVIGLLLLNSLTNTWDYSSYIEAYKKLVIQREMIEEFDARQLQTNFLQAVFLVSPVLNRLLLYSVFGLFAAVLSITSLVGALFIKQKYIILFIPQFTYIFISIILQITGLINFDILTIIQGTRHINSIIITFVIYLFVITTMYMIGVKKNRDVFY